MDDTKLHFIRNMTKNEMLCKMYLLIYEILRIEMLQLNKTMNGKM